MKIQDEFVTKDIALALKELGFDEKCMVFFGEGEKLEFICSMPAIEGKVYMTAVIGGAYSGAPTYQAVLAWFRDEHGIIGCIGTRGGKEEYPKFDSYTSTKYDDRIKQALKELQGGDYMATNCYNTNEEAQTALIWKLIEEVKNGS